MLINKLLINDLRVIERLELVPAPGLNLFFGGNGAGKTSVLEAVYLAGRGRTFRHSSAGPMIRHGADATTIVVDLLDEDSRRESRLGVRRGKSELVCRLDGDDVKKRSRLAEALPVQWVGSQPQAFLDQGPEVRRRFFDMGLFHVEHGYLAVYSDNHRTLKQRNAALKTNDARTATAWNAAFAAAAEAIHAYREPFIAKLMNRVQELTQAWEMAFEVAYRYRKGWSDGKDLVDQLQDRLELDMRMGFTSNGPQRAEVELLADGANAEKTLSRGQQKMLVLALNLALAELQGFRAGRKPVMLIDDLNAELDQENQDKVVGALVDLGVQVFLTSIAEPKESVQKLAGAMFHVEHGQLIGHA